MSQCCVCVIPGTDHVPINVILCVPKSDRFPKSLFFLLFPNWIDSPMFFFQNFKVFRAHLNSKMLSAYHHRKLLLLFHHNKNTQCALDFQNTQSTSCHNIIAFISSKNSNQGMTYPKPIQAHTNRWPMDVLWYS